MLNLRIKENIRIYPKIDNANTKKEVIKSLLIKNIIEKYRSELYWIRIYSNLPIGESDCDVYFESIKRKKSVYYYIIKNKKDLSSIKERYKTLEPIFLNKKICIISESDFSNDLDEINYKIEEYIK